MAAIPEFRLYGEPPGDPELRFVHLETIPARGRLHDWSIHPHRHAALRQFLLVETGGGTMTADASHVPFRAPAFIAVPPRVVHGFRFERDTDGHVLTLSEGFSSAALAGVQEAEVRAALDRPLALGLSEEGGEASRFAAAFREIAREFHGAAPGRASAIAAHVMLLLVWAARRGAAGAEAPAASPDLRVLDRLRKLVEARFRERLSVEAYAQALGVGAGRLNAACRRAAGRSTLEIVHERLLLEAKRNLVYTSMTVAEVAYSLGFEDPAYFSRFFARRAGLSPLAFRRRHAAGTGTPADEAAGKGLE